MATAYAALVSLLNNLDLIQNHPRHSFSFHNNQITSLREIIIFLIDFMQTNSYSHGGSKEIEAAEILEAQIACAAHAAEDIIESHVVDQIRGGDENTSSSFPLDLQNVIDDMDVVKRNAIKVQKVQSRVRAEQPPTSSSTPQPSEKKSDSMVGFDEVLRRLMELLVGEASSRRVVVPVVGTGGIGKTTLARNAYENPLIVQHFDVRLWATISQQHVVGNVFKQLLSCLRKFSSGTVDELGLYKILCGRRYLIVLDDMWSVEVWDKIKFFFPDTSEGSRILVTTRQSDVADYLGSLKSGLEMKILDEGKSWELFCQKAFVEQGCTCPPHLEEIGKNIVIKCKGLPLAIVVVGGYLGKSSRMQEYWENVANHMGTIFNLAKNEQLFNILSLSYSHLPVHLKPCFLYIGTFKEDQVIPIQHLIRLWIAEGFLKPNSDQILEEIAEGYLKELSVRNLITVYRKGSLEKITNCSIHDVLRELCLKIAEKEKFFCVVRSSRAIRTTERRVVIDERIQEEMHDDGPRSSSSPLVRSLTWEMSDELPPLDMKLLRVLNKVDGEALVNEVDEGSFLKAHFHLVNLRYFSCLRVKILYDNIRYFRLPSSISHLWNLQTLILKGFYMPFIAPNDIWEMLQLRYIELDGICLPHPLPSKRLNFEDNMVLQNLHTLLGVDDFKLSEEVYRRIPNVKELRVQFHDFEREYDHEASSYHKFECFHKLESLTCLFGSDSNWHDFALSLEFPSLLKSLFLTNSRLHWEELTTMAGSLPNLETLKLHENSVVGSKWSPIEGKFLGLKFLTISSCDDLTCLEAEKAHFPVLEYLFLQGLSKLDEIPSGIGEIATFRRIDLHRCNVCLAISAMEMLVEQEEEYGNEDLRLDVHFWGDGKKLDNFKKEVHEKGLRNNNLRLHLY
ncbi:hypothetical protein C2S53_011360 [Perilla frutescens var. hirtella]|uniref:NB-ARC domain-containing protein n=1 Tax=Perilla frutescens var. hirtella TaxID=608512 RepID=A0AAD4J8W9_PERFH|nr:hypothetical protein C2S53_011360 [Perilla frutescens var. hirtella]